LPLSLARSSSCALNTSVGVSGPHDFAVRATLAFVFSQLVRPSQFRLTCRDDRDTSLFDRGGMREACTYFRETEARFSSTELDSRISVESAHEFRFFMHAIVAVAGARPPDWRDPSSLSGESSCTFMKLIPARDGCSNHPPDRLVLETRPRTAVRRCAPRESSGSRDGRWRERCRIAPGRRDRSSRRRRDRRWR
jgi:hypothetical protein